MDGNQSKLPDHFPTAGQTPVPNSQCIDWYADGESRIVDVGGIQIRFRIAGRKGRRVRIAITAPPGAIFLSRESQNR